MGIYLLVFLGGGLGSMARFLLSRFIPAIGITAYPWATFFANVLSCFILGILVSLRLRGWLPQQGQFFFITGFCGGFSTFSTFSVEAFQLLEQGRLILAFSYIGSSLVFGLFALYLGIRLLQ